MKAASLELFAQLARCSADPKVPTAHKNFERDLVRHVSFRDFSRLTSFLYFLFLIKLLQYGVKSYTDAPVETSEGRLEKVV